MAEEDPSNQQQRQEPGDPYAILKVRKDATLEEIQQNYKFLSRTFHPDKQTSADAADAAQEIFVTFKNAHDILTDPVLRQAYDLAGHRGVQMVRLTLHSQDEYALYPSLHRLHQTNQVDKARRLVREAIQQSDIEQQDRLVEFTASMEFPCTLETSSSDDVDGLLECEEATVQVSVTSPSQSKWGLTIGGGAHTKNGLGSSHGSAGVTYKPVTGTTLQADVDVSDPMRFALSSTRTLANRTMITTSMRKVGNNFAWNVISHRALWKNQVRATWALGLAMTRRRPLSMQYGLISVTTLMEDYPTCSLKVNLGMNQYPIKVSAKKEISEGRVLNGSFGWGPTGIEVKALFERSLTSYCTWSMGLQHATLEGLTWFLQLKRGNVSFQVPITITSKVGTDSYGYTLIYWSLMNWLLDEVIGETIAEEELSTPRVERKEEHASLMELEKSKLDAEQQVAMMTQTATFKDQREAAKGGLVILSATYYMDGPTSRRTSMDVTIPLQFWVSADSRLTLPSAPKSQLLGFYKLRDTSHESKVPWWRRMVKGRMNPTSKVKQDKNDPMLRIRYQYGGDTFEVTVRDDEGLQLPCQSALKLGSNNRVR